MEKPQTDDLISVIIPVYNTQDFLDRCIQSLKMQTHPHWEAILINDGSTDSSGEICDNYAKNDSRVQVIHQINKGVSAARNKGLKIATGTFISFIDSDDYLEPDMLKKLLSWIKNRNADIAACGYYLKRNNRITIPAKELKKELNTEEAIIALMHRNYYQGFLWNKLFNNSIFSNKTSTEVFHEDIFLCEDLLFLSECIAQGAKLVYYNEPLYWHCRRKQSLMQSSNVDRANELYARKKIIEIVRNVSPRAFRMAQSKYCESAVNLLYYATINKDIKTINVCKAEAKKYLKIYYKNKDILVFEKFRIFLKLHFPKLSIVITTVLHFIKI